MKMESQSLKHKVNRLVLCLRLNECSLSALQTVAGRLFHTSGPATEKALSPNFILVHGTVQSVLDFKEFKTGMNYHHAEPEMFHTPLFSCSSCSLLCY